MRVLKSASLVACAMVAQSWLSSGVHAADDSTIVDEWSSIKFPAPLSLKPVTVDPKTTALLILDVVDQICKPSKPRCLASVPKIKSFLSEARAHGVRVVYTLGGGATKKDIVKELAPTENEPAISAHADKFIGSDLEKTLSDMHVDTLVTVGVAAEGAVLYTASHGAFLGYKIIDPIDGSSSDTPFREAATAWILANAPGVGAKTTLTKFSMMGW